MQKARETLTEYRQRVKEEKLRTERKICESEPCSSKSLNVRPSGPSLIQRLLAIDVLDSIPFLVWRKFYGQNPTLTLIVSVMMYIVGQTYFIWIEFGLVFFVLSALCALCLSLGKRQEGEISAYSVFNPNCERLLGQMTAEHFERDVLRRRVQ